MSDALFQIFLEHWKLCGFSNALIFSPPIWYFLFYGRVFFYFRPLLQYEIISLKEMVKYIFLGCNEFQANVKKYVLSFLSCMHLKFHEITFEIVGTMYLNLMTIDGLEL